MLIADFIFSLQGYKTDAVKIARIFQKKFPQNLVVRQPLPGALLIAGICFVFLLAYRPLSVHETSGMTYAQTMAIYCALVAFGVFLAVKLLKMIPWFASKEQWTFLKEILSTILVLTCLGIVIYLAAFFIEPPADRWNMSTLLDSLKNAFLIGILPFALFTGANLGYLFSEQGFQPVTIHPADPSAHPGEERIEIDSRLKKEKLSFFPSQFIYAEADGNYIVFYLSDGDAVKKKTIRNSITNIEKQLAHIPHFFRTHRAFIVNLKKVSEKEGNVAGFRLSIKGSKQQIPVSRQNTKAFEQVWEEHSL